jgi:alpha-L-rhamnosidase
MNFKNYLFIVTAILLFSISCQNKKEETIQIVNLRCENRIDPLGIDNIEPKLSWNLESILRNKKQSAYQILVSDSQEALSKNKGDLWDTQKVNSNRSIQIPYEGKELTSERLVYWKLRVWDEQGKISVWSQPAKWEMGLINRSDWKGNWISDGKTGPQKINEFYEEDASPLFRSDFIASKKIKKARLYISGLGYYEATINGKKVGDHVLDPGWTNYSKRVLYATYDVTKMINDGGNSIGVELGNGWFNPLPMKMFGGFNLREALATGRPKFIAQLIIEFVDGKKQTIVSNDKWKTQEGPILRNNIFLGEIYDARKEIPNWDIYGFEDSEWKQAKITSEKIGKLQAQDQPPIKITGKVKPVKLTEPKANVFIFDMGQNFAGWVKLKVKATAGTEVKLRYGELLHEDGTLNFMTSVAGQIKGKNKNGELKGGPYSPDIAWQSDTYIASGKELEYYTPKFTFHAFRYVEVTGYPGTPEIDDMEGMRLSSDLTKVGSFECSNKLFNDIQKITEWTFLSNVFSVQSDCPHRERFGYGGDLAVTTDAFIYNYDMANFYTKVVRDFQDAALPDGRLTDTAPFVGIDYCGIGWAFSHPLTLLELYQYYGNISLIEEQYETARKWFEVVLSNNDLIITHGLSDHESLAPIPTSEMVTPLYYQSAVIMSKLAEIIGRTEDAKKYKDLSVRIRIAYLDRFQDEGTGKFAPYTQGSQSFALYTGISPNAKRQDAVYELVKNIEEKNGGHLSTGIFGTKYALDVLSENGYAQTAANMVDKKTFPGWGFMLNNGATTLWEHWDYSDNTYSHNHPMFGSVSEWFYKWLAGIQADPTAIGFDNIIIRPQVVSNVSWVKAEYKSIQGNIISEWKRNEDIFSLDIKIPVNTTALIYIPSSDLKSIREGNRKFSELKDIELIKMANGTAVLKIGSGKYSFTSKL